MPEGQVVFIRGSSGNNADVDTSGNLKVVGTISANVSGNVVNISGQSVSISGQPVSISGQPVNANISGNKVNISGDTIKQQIPTVIITGTEIVGASLSGGTALPSGVSVSVTIKYNASNSGKGYLGGNSAQAPFSGKGIRLEPGDSYTVAITNPAALQVFASVSGDTISWIANQF